jgi:hypothetical protein
MDSAFRADMLPIMARLVRRGGHVRRRSATILISALAVVLPSVLPGRERGIGEAPE